MIIIMIIFLLQTYMGKTIVRGIETDHWQSCMYWELLSSNFTLDYFFSGKACPLHASPLSISETVKRLQVSK